VRTSPDPRHFLVPHPFTPSTCPPASHFPTTPSTCLRRRPLYCGSVLRLCRYTGIIPSFSRLLIYYLADPTSPTWMSIQPLDPSVLPSMIHRYRHASQFLLISELFLYMPLPPPLRHSPTVKTRRLISVTFATPSIHPSSPSPCFPVPVSVPLSPCVRTTFSTYVEGGFHRSEHCMFARAPDDGSTGSAG
jgi:hypothetical protein